MKTSCDLQSEIDSRIKVVLGDGFDTKNLQIDFSFTYPKGYPTLFHQWATNIRKPKIDDFFGKYDVNKNKVIIYLPVLHEVGKLIRFRFEHMIRIIIYYEIGHWICNNIKFGKSQFESQAYANTGSKFRNFISLMLAYEMVKFDESLMNCFVDLITILDEDHSLCLKFLEVQKDGNKYLPGLKLVDLLRLLKKVITTGEVNISNAYLMENFDKYITNCILKETLAIGHFRDVMTDRQKVKWKHLSKEYGFFDE